MTGLAFLGMLVGSSLGNILYVFEDRRYIRLLDKNNGQPLPPENRLPMTILGAVCMPIALFIFAFTSYPHVHWIAQILAGIPFGLSQFCIFLCSQTYMLDTYLAHAASALAANAILRAIVGSVFPLFVSEILELPSLWDLANSSISVHLRSANFIMASAMSGLLHSWASLHYWACRYHTSSGDTVHISAETRNTLQDTHQRQTLIRTRKRQMLVWH